MRSNLPDVNSIATIAERGHCDAEAYTHELVRIETTSQ